MHPVIPSEMVADPLGSAEHTSGTTALRKSTVTFKSKGMSRWKHKGKLVHVLPVKVQERVEL